MKSSILRSLGYFSLGLLLLGSPYGCGNAEPGVAVDPETLFTFEVYPLLEAKCFACHGEDADNLEGDLDMRSLEGLLAGGATGQPALVPGEPRQSNLYLAASRQDPDFAMPPKENDKLSLEHLKLLDQWIRQGAPWPDAQRQQEILATTNWDYKGKVPVKVSGGLSDSWINRRYDPKEIWAFYPVEPQTVPWPTKADEATMNPIDAFLEQKLNEQDLKPAQRADKRDLIRRATFDLIGLSPTNAEVEAFLKDDSEQAFERVVERLLASPHYGEQWGRHWLDVVRYADSDGQANDYARPNAWRYRDYVVRAFNNDKPYYQFVLEQVAGDELDPDNPEMLVATGFLRMGPWEHTSMSIAAETRQFFLDDVTNSVGEVFLSQPLRCARCHDHKFDPIPTRDFYSVQAVFATTQFAERPAPYLSSENLTLDEKEKKILTDFIAEAQDKGKAINEKEEQAARLWYRERGKPYLPKRARRKLPDDQQPPRYIGLTFQELGYRKVLSKHIQRKRRELEGFDTLAFSVYNGPPKRVHSGRPIRMSEDPEGEMEETFILTGGSVYAPAEKVPPGILSALPALQPPPVEQEGRPSLDVDIPETMSGRRLHFARWLIHPDNPLTTRSIVNRVWQYHFGKGIAENTNNFGVTGKPPSHPELLDWLAQHFVDQGWSIKALHRLIMSSEAYRRSTQHTDIEHVRTIDPDNLYLAVFSARRLAAEEMRDAMLQATEELNPALGGRPVRPEIHLEVALQPRQIMGSVAPAYQPSPTRAERNRRTLYALRRRGIINPMLEVFNRPGPDLSCEKRSASSVTPQVFMQLNDRSMRDRAIALATFTERSSGEVEERVRQIFQRVLIRDVRPEELQESLAYVNKMIRYHQEHRPVEEAYPKLVERIMFEEMTGENFNFEEELQVYDNYEADLKAWEVDTTTRALADLAVVLFNSNEFMYVY